MRLLAENEQITPGNNPFPRFYGKVKIDSLINAPKLEKSWKLYLYKTDEASLSNHKAHIIGK